MRKLAKIVKIESIVPIENSDNIELVKWGGWQCVVKKNEFKVGDLVIAFEIDSWIPDELAPFLTKAGQFPKVYNGVQGQKLRTIRLRGQLSQGLIMPFKTENYDSSTSKVEEGLDLTEHFGIQKWEPEIVANMRGITKGSFPHFISKSSQERCQNLVTEIFTEHIDEEYEVTIKLDGSSMTVYRKDGEVGVCSRNLELKIDDNTENTFVRTTVESKLLEALKILSENIAVQGELMGPGIQGNREDLPNHRFFVYDIWDIEHQVYVSPTIRGFFISKLREFGADIHHVPVYRDYATMENLGVNTIDDLLAIANGESLNHKVREGLVFKSYNSEFSFKAISNSFLEKESLYFN